MLASPARPLSREAHLTKFRGCWAYAAEPLDPAGAETLIGMVDALETLQDVRALLSPMTQGTSGLRPQGNAAPL
jgi:hypothetical protein